jgi:hypothetical protein
MLLILIGVMIISSEKETPKVVETEKKESKKKK